MDAPLAASGAVLIGIVVVALPLAVTLVLLARHRDNRENRDRPPPAWRV